MKRKNSFAVFIATGLFFLVFSFIPSTRASLGTQKTQLEAMTEKVEKTITKASDMFEAGKIKKGAPYIARISPTLTLTFRAENFDQDLEKAFNILDNLMTRAQKASPSKQQAKNAPKTHNAGKSRHLTPSPPPPPKKNPKPRDRISALMQAESRHPKRRPLTAKEVPIQYSTYKSYSALHKSREAQQDKAAEADMQIVNRERQLAEQELQQRRAQKQQVQVQAMKWQAELDKEAAESASKQAAYEAEHSFGAYVKRFFTTVLQTAIGSFTGAFIGNIGSHLADKAVGSLFHLPSDSPAAAGVSAAVNSAASSTGQAVSNGVTSSLSRSTQSPTPSKPISPSQSWKNSPAIRKTGKPYRPNSRSSSSYHGPQKGIWAQDPNWVSKIKFYGINKNKPPHIVKCGTPYLQRHYRPIKKKVKY